MKRKLKDSELKLKEADRSQNKKLLPAKNKQNLKETEKSQNRELLPAKNKQKKGAEIIQSNPTKMSVTPGKLIRENAAKVAQREAAEEKQLAIMMMHKKDKYLYDKIIFGQKRKKREVCILLFAVLN